MWRRKEGVPHDPPHVIFMDKEVGLSIKQDVIGDFRAPPFRDDVFSLVFLDPPFSWHIHPRHLHPSGYGLGSGKSGKFRGSWYGKFKNRTDLLTSLYRGQKALSEIADRMCFKWNEYDLNLFRVLSLFTDWTLVNIKEYRSRKKRSKVKTFWVTLTRKTL